MSKIQLRVVEMGQEGWIKGYVEMVEKIFRSR